jgi:hypothetical protein
MYGGLMNLISCGACGVVLDLSRITPPEIWKDDKEEEGSVINHDNAFWDGGDYVPTMHCPSCKSRIIVSTGDRV